MTIGRIAVLGIFMATSAAAQMAERKNGQVVAADFDYALTLQRCAIGRQGDAMAVSGRLFVRFQPDQRSAPGAVQDNAVELAIAASPGGGMPVVLAHAINTKGTGGTNHRMAASACAFEPTPSLTVTGSQRGTGARCSVSGDAGGVTATFSLPLATLDATAKNYVGHVTINRRGMAPAGATVVQCDGEAMRATYDLAIGKKV